MSSDLFISNRTVVAVVLILSMIITYMLVLVPAREHIENFVLNYFEPSKGFYAEMTKNVVRSILVISTAIVAIQTPYFSSVLSTVGGLTDAYQSYIIPPLIALKMASSSSSTPSTSSLHILLYRFIFLWGIWNVGFTCYRIMLRLSLSYEDSTI